MRLSPVAGFGVLLVMSAGTGCQAITDLIPSLPSSVKASPSPSPSASPGLSLPALAIPVVLPTPKPTPVPTPTPAPLATPEPPPAASNCSLPASNPSNPSCTFDPPRLEAEVENAITRVTESHPQYFKFNDTRCGNCYLVKNIDGYVAEVQRQLASRGICTYWDGEELAAKDSNAASEQYDILLASNHIRRAPGAYRGVCRPSWF
jgi:hypothetical protein